MRIIARKKIASEIHPEIVNKIKKVNTFKGIFLNYLRLFKDEKSREKRKLYRESYLEYLKKTKQAWEDAQKSSSYLNKMSFRDFVDKQNLRS